uniref:Uncharacterized protein n=1 Tax=Chromera velia CCMP2878 TaxID=1169474 RepID=A0A0G4I1Y7_9ALVE|mmetsp:Transcript_52976/g.103625  ORF Transcript_52976/g.103625 Transcript_52976/m.103625 type:complete len:261 (+) Transcript_52976:73-855(+)|eukprot:Cvel_10230.t1-p1 / transcript=Cvel_10230.t1 / gene=Cvel_10230 / organism=Chromera_velia_CCMP2878 / gene_product=hypothetical protein / transcript_product=hypothetical protein / location=Cvel_scaffold612:75045-76351(+) / protein_length=260 / sequence_SO=supercontig / SO=protein_coding / is_pseudo=false
MTGTSRQGGEPLSGPSRFLVAFFAMLCLQTAGFVTPRGFSSSLLLRERTWREEASTERRNVQGTGIYGAVSEVNGESETETGTQIPPTNRISALPSLSSSPMPSRRDFLLSVGAAVALPLLSLSFRPTDAWADSVGIGVRITAQKRYGAAVEAGANAFRDLKGGIEAGSPQGVSALKEFVKGPDGRGTIQAMQLLANSYRKSENQRPDTIPQRMKLSEFEDALEALTSIKDTAAVKGAYADALKKMEVYLESVSDVRAGK